MHGVGHRHGPAGIGDGGVAGDGEAGRRRRRGGQDHGASGRNRRDGGVAPGRHEGEEGEPGEDDDERDGHALAEHLAEHAGLAEGAEPEARGERGGDGNLGDHAKGADPGRHGDDPAQAGTLAAPVVNEREEGGDPGGEQRPAVRDATGDGAGDLPCPVLALAEETGDDVVGDGGGVTDGERHRAADGVAVGGHDAIGDDVGAVAEVGLQADGDGRAVRR